MKPINTVKDLKTAVETRQSKILIQGKLAEAVNQGLKLKRASKWAVGLLAAALASTPLTGAIGVAAAAPVAALTGIEIITIIAVVTIGISLILVICKDYKRVDFKGKKGDCEAELMLERV